MDSEDPFCRRSDRSELSVEKGKRGRARKEKGLKTQGDGTLGGGRIGGGTGRHGWEGADAHLRRGARERR